MACIHLPSAAPANPSQHTGRQLCVLGGPAPGQTLPSSGTARRIPKRSEQAGDGTSTSPGLTAATKLITTLVQCKGMRASYPSPAMTSTILPCGEALLVVLGTGQDPSTLPLRTRAALCKQSLCLLFFLPWLKRSISG